ncbi:MAG TPA: class I SAM-dependent methyltransferase [Hyphomicrobiaceae bacterium]|nr:class I SAM-dependent methyltransferase [Hyphomicrobiaceae bacterium]
MYVDVTELRDFYARPLGGVVRRLIGHRIRAKWRNVSGRTVIGLGFASPYLGPYQGEALRLGAFMPAAQGALVWPRSGLTQSALVDDEALPLRDESVDFLLAAHCLEGAERVRPLLQEMWRVLSPEGRLLLVVPNRRSIWARTESTPFGHGRPYSRGQLESLLTEALFTSAHWSWALHMPPIERPSILQSAIAFERIGARIWPSIGGVMIVEARKQLSAPTGNLQRARASRRLVTVQAASRSAGQRKVGPGKA